MSQQASLESASIRDVLVGCHSTVWRHVSVRMSSLGRDFVAIGHSQTATFAFTPNDRVWVLSFSLAEQENVALLRALAASGVGEIVYVSSSSTIISEFARCYKYPRVKHAAEREALALDRSRILTIGLAYATPLELPGGPNVATSYDELASFMAAPQWPEAEGRRKHLFHIVERPFRHRAEQVAYIAYGRLIAAAGRLPCLLRPADLVLRALGARWYGYTYLSNKLWISTIS